MEISPRSNSDKIEYKTSMCVSTSFNIMVSPYVVNLSNSPPGLNNKENFSLLGNQSKPCWNLSW